MTAPFRVIAIIAAFNEGDIISQVISHLVENEVDVYLIDNHSTDNTVREAKRWLGRGLLGIESFPVASPAAGEPHPKFDWEAILERKEQLACELPADWFIHHDADEFREGPWPGVSLRESIRWVDELGYNCLDFLVLNFPPLDDDFEPGDDPRSHFRFCEDAQDLDRVQLKCWKAAGTRVSLARSGGHEACFEGRRVFPIQFLLRHYPVRGQKHGLKKVFEERKGRFLESERSRGWHRQYDQAQEGTENFLRLEDSPGLRRFDPERVRLELMAPRARKPKCWLRVAGESTASLETSPDQDIVRVSITEALTDRSYDIQVNFPHFHVKRENRYAVNFLARAGSARTAVLGFGRAHEPWDDLGLYEKIRLESEWMTFERIFTAIADEDNARIYFDVGLSEIPVEVSAITLRSLTEGCFVEQALYRPCIGAPGFVARPELG